MTSLLLVGPSYGTNADRNGPWLRKLSPSGSGVPPIYVADDTYDVFVSYSRADGRHVAEIDSVLHKGLKTFFDRRNLATGLPWVRVLEQAIGAPRAVIVLIGPRGLGNTQQYKRDLAFVRQTRDPAFRPWSSTLGRATRSGICANTQLACLFGEHRIQ